MSCQISPIGWSMPIHERIILVKGFGIMATFFVLPSRQVLGQRFGEMVSAIFPCRPKSSWDWPDLAETLAEVVERQGNAYVVYREDLDDDLGVKDSLLRDFGAALDDEIIEIQFGA